MHSKLDSSCNISHYLFLLSMIIFWPSGMIYGQLCSGTLGDPVFFETFGTGTGRAPFPSGGGTTNYTYNGSNGTVQDGEYTLWSSAPNPLNSGWHTSGSDHTGDFNGRMAVFNASFAAGLFYQRNVSNLCPGTVMQFSAWISNILKPDCSFSCICVAAERYPDVTFQVLDPNTSAVLGSINTGSINSTTNMTWNEYGFLFTVPSGISNVILEMVNNSVGGCGNDLAIDDISFRACGPTASITGNDPSCNGAPVTLNTVVGSGLSQPAYQWQIYNSSTMSWQNISGATGSSYVETSPIDGATYRYIVAGGTSALGNPNCRTASDPYSISVVTLSCDVNGDDIICDGQSTTLTANPTPTSGDYSYSWSSGQSSQSINVSPSTTTTYTVTITDNPSGCTTDCSSIVLVFDPSCTINGLNEICSGQSADLTANPSGGTGEYTYDWSSGGTSAVESVSPTATTTYSVTITDITAGCTFICDHTVTVYDPMCSISGDQEICVGQNTLLTSAVTGSTGNLQYSWSTGANTPTIDVSPTSTTTYSLTVTDITLNCSTECDITVQVSDPSCNITGDNIICDGQSTTLTANLSGGSGNQNYAWSNGSVFPSISVSPNVTSNYSVTITDVGLGCNYTCDLEVEVFDPTCTIMGPTDACAGDNITLSSNVMGGSGNYTYQWSHSGGSASTAMYVVSMSETYSLTVTDETADCQTVCTFDVSVDDTPPDLTNCNLDSPVLECAGTSQDQNEMIDWHNANLADLVLCAFDDSDTFNVTSDFNLDNFISSCSGGSMTVTYTVADTCANTATIQSTITFEDTTPPDTTGCNLGARNITIDCMGKKAGVTQAAQNWHDANLALLSNCASDVCGNVNIAADYNVGNIIHTCGNAGLITVQYVLTDDCNHSIQFALTMTIIDTVPPNLTNCQVDTLSKTYDCTGFSDRNQQITNWHNNNLTVIESCAADDCSTPSVTSDFDLVNFVNGCGGSGSLEVTYYVSDACANMVEVALEINFIDTDPPDTTGCDLGDLNDQIECLGLAGNQQAITDWHNGNLTAILGCARDECDTFAITHDFDLNNFVDACGGNAGSIIVNYTLTDNCGNAVSFAATFDITDTTPPDTTGCNLGALNQQVECMDIEFNQQSIIDWHAANLAAILGCASDACDTFAITHDYALANFVDACGGNAGSIVVNYTLTDSCGNAVSFAARFTIVDTTPPDVSGCVPGSLDVQTECGGAGADSIAIAQWHIDNQVAILACAVDACDTFTLTSNYDPNNFVITCGSGGSITVIYTLTDSCGNASTFNATYSTSDITPPDTTGCNLGDLNEQIECLGLAGNQQAISDWHDANLTTILGCATDECDTFAITHDFDLNNFVDACGGNAGSIVVNYTLTDSCDNAVSFAARFTIVDTTPPDTTGCNLGDLNEQIECLGLAGNQQAITDWHDANLTTILGCAIDECDTFAITHDFDINNFVDACGGNAGSIVVNYTLTDSCDNAVSFAATFTIVDTTPPDTTGCNLGDLNEQIECLGLTGNQQAITDWHDANLTAILTCAQDECDTFAITHDFDLNNFVDVCGGNAGSIVVNYTLTDSCGNAVSFAARFTIVDTTPPDVSGCVPGSLDVQTECGGAGADSIAIAQWHIDNQVAILACAVDACDTFTLTSNYDPNNFVITCGSGGSITVIYTLTDSCGNVSTFNATYSTSDITPPDTTACNLGDLNEQIECLGLAGNQQAITDWHNANLTAILGCASDACDTFAITHDFDLNNFVDACGGNAGSIVVNYTLTDNCDNAVSFAATFTIVDTTPPDTTGCNLGDLNEQIECLGLAGNQQAISDWHDANLTTILGCATDECDTFAITHDFDLNNFVDACGGNAGSIVVNYTLTDSCDNAVSFAATFTIVDTTPPDTTGCNLGELNEQIECLGLTGNQQAITDWHDANLTTILGCAIDECDTFAITHDFDINNFVDACGGNAGSIVVNYTLTDSCDNAVSFAATFTIVDTTPPDTTGCNLGDLNEQIECLGLTGNQQAITDWHDANLTAILTCAQDECDTFSITHDFDLNNFVDACGGNAGSIVVNYTLTDSCGNAVSFAARFTIVDTTPPDVSGCVPGSLDVQTECGGAGADSIAIAQWHIDNQVAILACAVDACDTFTLTSDYDPNNFVITCGSGGSITVVYTLTDSCGNVSTFNATYTTSDITPPDTTGCNLGDLNEQIECLGLAGNQQAITDWHDANLTAILGCASDACDTFAITHDFDLNNFVDACGGNAGSIVVYYTLTDNCTNAVSFDATFDIVDTTPPDTTGCNLGDLNEQIECLGQTGNEQAIADWHAANVSSILGCASDGCDTFLITDDYDLTNFMDACGGNAGSITVNYTLTDSCGNAVSFPATFDIVDTTPPDTTGCNLGDLNEQIECLGQTGNEQAITDWHAANLASILGCASDGCDTFAITDNYDLDNFMDACGGNAGSITVNYTLTDSCGNAVSFPATFDIVDTTPPDTTGCNLGDLNEQIECLGLTGNEQAIADWHVANVSSILACASDGCDTFLISDDYDLTNFTDACGGNAGSITVNYTLTDSCGNAVSFPATFDIVDTTPPDTTGCNLGDLNIQTECGGATADSLAIVQWHADNQAALLSCATDACDTFMLTSDYDPTNFTASCGNGGSIDVEYTLTDSCGNAVAFTATYSTADVTPPDTTGCNLGDLNDQIECLGLTGNQQAISDWHDANLASILACASDACDTFAITDNYDLDNFMDACGGNAGSITITYTLTDNCSNAVSFDATFDIVDTTPPDTTGCNLGDLNEQIECLGQTGNEQAIADWHAANVSSILGCASDGCDTFLITDDYDLTNFMSTCGGNAGSITVNYTLTDSCGNAVSFPATFDIVDTTPPDTTGCNLGDLNEQIECLGLTGNEQAIADWHAANVSSILGCASDGCDTFMITDNYDLDNFMDACGGNAGSITVNYTLTDSCGNAVSFPATFDIVDTTPPDTTGCNLGDLNEQIECLGLTGNEQAIADWHVANVSSILACASDGCDTFLISDDYDLTNFTDACGGNAGSITVNYTLTDSCGNAVSFPATFDIVDTTPPDTTGCNLGDLNIQTECGGATADSLAIVQWHADNQAALLSCATDACDTFMLTSDYDPTNFTASCGNGGSIDVEYTLTDSCGNAVAFTVTYSTADVTPPDTTGCNLGDLNDQIECLGLMGNQQAISDWHDANLASILACASDACDTFAITGNYDLDNFMDACGGNAGSITITYTLTDNCSNAVSFDATFDIVDTTPPDTTGCNLGDLNEQIECLGQTGNEQAMADWHAANVSSILGCASDGCDTFMITDDYDLTNFMDACGGNAGSITVNYTLTDSCGNAVSFPATFDIVDTTPPDTTGCNLGDLNEQIECLGQTGNEQAIADWHAANLASILGCASDGCDTFAITDNYDLDNFMDACGGNAGSITVNYTLTDSCGNAVSFPATFDIVDTTPPDTTGCNLGDLNEQIECLGLTGNEQAIADWHVANVSSILACASDGCDTFLISDDYDLTNFMDACGGNAGSITVNYTLTDSCGNAVSFPATFDIVDTTPPDTTGCNLGDLNIQTECGGATADSLAIVQWHADNQAALLSCATDACDTFMLTGDYDPTNFTASCGNGGSIDVEYTLTDSCGNAVAFTVTFSTADVTPPDTTGCNLGDLNDQIECLGLTGNQQAISDWHDANLASILACASDACDTFAITSNYDLDSFVSTCGGNAGSITVSYTLTDNCTNAVSFDATFDIVDTTPPDTTGCNLGDLNEQIECLGQTGNEQAIADWHAANVSSILGCAIDGCDTFLITDDYDLTNFMDACGGNAGSITVNYTLTDSCGNAVSFPATFDIVDTTPPDTTGCNLGDLNEQIECLGQTGNEQAITDWHAANLASILGCASDGCDTFAITDNYDLDNFMDACGGNAGSITVNYTLTDSCGNAVSFPATFDIVDTTPPDTTGCNLGDLNEQIECLGLTGNEQAIADWHVANVSSILACASDGCDTFLISDDYDLTNFMDACGGNAGSITVNYTLTDSCGNAVSFPATFDIVDTTPPDTTGCNLGDLNIQTECGGATADSLAIVQWHADNQAALLSCATDACDTFMVTSDYDPTNFTASCGNGGSIDVEYTLTDSCGNAVAFTVTFSTADVTPPDTTGCNLGDLNDQIECLGLTGNQQAISDWHDANLASILACASDACDTFAITDNYDLDNFMDACGGNAGSITITYTLTDNCSNAVSFDATFDIVDTTPPDTTGCNLGDLNEQIECLGQTGNEQAIADWHAANVSSILGCASDGCDTFLITDDYDLTNFNSTCGGNAGSITVNYTLTDSCGNAVSFDATFDIVDTTPPDTTGCNLGDLNEQIECLGQPGNEQAIADWHAANLSTILGCASDGCDTFLITDDYDLTNFVDACGGNAGSITVNYTLTDSCGNAVSFPATFDIVDTTPPDTTGCNLGDLNEQIECLGLTGNEQAISDWHVANVASILACASDGCDTFMITDDYDLTNFMDACGGNAGSITVNYTLTDSCGNAVSFPATFDIVDTTPPDTTGCNLGDLNIQTQCFGAEANEAFIEVWHLSNLATIESCVVEQCDSFTIASDYDLSNFVADCGDNTGSLTAIYTVSDQCGNSVDIRSTITIIDTIPPDTSQCDLTAMDMAMECEGVSANEQAVISWHEANMSSLYSCVTEQCDTFVVSSDFSLNNFITDCGNAGYLPVNYQIADNCGNSIGLSATFTISDTTAPILLICPSPELMDPFDELDIPTYSDCSGLTVTYLDDTIYSYLECPLGTVERTFYATDECGNVDSSCVLQRCIVCEDSIMFPPDLVLDCGEELPDPDEFAKQYPDYVIRAFTEEIDTDCGHRFIRKWKVVDYCVDEYVQKITMVDETPPVLTTPADTTIECGDLPSIWHEVEDNCSDVTVDFEEEISGEACSCTYDIIRRWTATDGCGNQTINEQVITVIDTTAPTIQIINPNMAHIKNGSYIDMYGCGTPGINMMDFEINDCCTTTDTAYDELISLNLCSDGDYAKIWKCAIESVDYCGNKSTFAFYVRQIDTIAPQIFNVPNDTTIACGGLLPDPAANVVAEDNCDIDVRPSFEERIDVVTGDSSQMVVTRIWIASDPCGNEARAIQHIYTCNPDYTSKYASISGLIWEDTSENGIRDSVEMGIGDVLVKLYRIDLDDTTEVDQQSSSLIEEVGHYVFDSLPSGNYQVQITIPEDARLTAMNDGPTDVDNDFDSLGITAVIPVAAGARHEFIDAGLIFMVPTNELQIICLPDTIVPCGINYLARPSIQTTCDSVLDLYYVDIVDEGQCGQTTVTRTWIVIGCDGLQDSCVQMIRLEDHSAPVIGCRDTLYLTCATDTIPTPDVMDDCGSDIEWNHQDSVLDDNCGSTQIRRTWTAMDCAGNQARCVQTIMYLDTIAPTMICLSDTVLHCMPALGTLTPRVDDNCDPSPMVEASDVIEQGPCGVGQITRTWTAYDCAGNSSTCTQIITIIDTIAPEILCEAIELGCITALRAVPAPQIIDDCDTAWITGFVDSMDVDQCGSGTIYRTWAGTDCAGNVEHCEQIITIQQDLAPQVIEGSYPLEIDLPFGSNIDPDVLGVPEYKNVDGCSNNYLLQYRDDSTGYDANCEIGRIRRTFYVQDSCGNVDSSAFQFITILTSLTDFDQSNLPQDSTIFCGDSLPDYTYLDTIYRDYIIEQDTTFLEDSCGGRYEILYVFTQECDQYRHTQHLQVLDTVAPQMQLQGDTLWALGDSIEFVAPIITDHCSHHLLSWSDSIIQGGEGCEQIVRRTWRAEDQCGNATERVQIYHFIDSGAPIIEITTLGYNGFEQGDTVHIYGCEDLTLQDHMMITDDCTYESGYSIDEIASDCGDSGMAKLWRVLITATDQSRNEASLMFYVAQHDTVPPTLVGIPRDTVIECGDMLPPPATVSALDSCDQALSVDFEQLQIFDKRDSSSYAVIRRWRAADRCGNEALQEQIISVCSFDRVQVLNSIGGTVWLDENKDGLQGNSEEELDSVRVYLYKYEGTKARVVDSTLSGASDSLMQNYSFVGLSQGKYAVGVDLPDSMWHSPLNAGPDTIDSDVYRNGLSAATVVDIGQHVDVDAGLFRLRTEPISEILNLIAIEDAACFVEVEWTVFHRNKGDQVRLQESTNGTVYHDVVSYQLDDLETDSIIRYSYLDTLSINKLFYRVMVYDSLGWEIDKSTIFLESAGNCAPQSNIMIYPNPVSTMFSIDLEGHSERKMKLYVLDVLGRMMMKKDLEIVSGREVHQIDIYHLPAAPYILLIDLGGQKLEQFKIIKR